MRIPRNAMRKSALANQRRRTSRYIAMTSDAVRSTSAFRQPTRRVRVRARRRVCVSTAVCSCDVSLIE